jgi:hypothetical protein
MQDLLLTHFNPTRLSVLVRYFSTSSGKSTVHFGDPVTINLPPVSNIPGASAEEAKIKDITFVGGNAALLSHSGYKSWAESVKTDPAVLAVIVRPIYTMFPAQHVMKAKKCYDKYMNVGRDVQRLRRQLSYERDAVKKSEQECKNLNREKKTLAKVCFFVPACPIA